MIKKWWKRNADNFKVCFLILLVLGWIGWVIVWAIADLVARIRLAWGDF